MNISIFFFRLKNRGMEEVRNFFHDTRSQGVLNNHLILKTWTFLIFVRIEMQRDIVSVKPLYIKPMNIS